MGYDVPDFLTDTKGGRGAAAKGNTKGDAKGGKGDSEGHSAKGDTKGDAKGDREPRHWKPPFVLHRPQQCLQIMWGGGFCPLRF